MGFMGSITRLGTKAVAVPKLKTGAQLAPPSVLLKTPLILKEHSKSIQLTLAYKISGFVGSTAKAGIKIRPPRGSPVLISLQEVPPLVLLKIPLPPIPV